MDSPLNRAHQQERKAEQFILSKKYLEAVTCYEIAAGHITEAMKATTASQALVSMQLQYEDHLRKQRLLKGKLEQHAQAEKKLQELSLSQKDDIPQSFHEPDGTNIELLASEQNNLSLNSSLNLFSEGQDCVSNQSLVKNISREDLQMQVLSLTQALEDCNRENNHLRNIIVKFKEVLQTRFGLSEEEIEDFLIDNKELCEEPFLPSEISLEKINYDEEISYEDTSEPAI